MKEKTVFFCTSCGNETMKWQGRCPACGQWNTIVEHKAAPKPKGVPATAVKAGPRRSARPLMELDTTDEVRFSTGMTELDRVLGGGAVRGSLVLVGGAPALESPRCFCSCATMCPAASRYCMSPERNRRPS